MQGLINKIKSDPFAAVTVESMDGTIKPFVNYTLPKIKAEFGSVEGFFQKIERDYPNYRIFERRQNGTHNGKVNYKPIREVFRAIPAEPIYPQHNQLSMPGFGLSVPELISLKVDQSEKLRLQTENEFLKRENERLKEIEFDFKQYKLQTEYSDKKSAQTTTLITEALQSPVAVNLIQALLAPKGQGLANPAPAAVENDQFLVAYKSQNENVKNLFRNIMYLCQSKKGFFENIADIVEMEAKEVA